MKLSIATDAISADFETAILLGLEWGIEYFELKRVHHKRVPDITEDEVRIVQNVMRINSVRLSTLSPGLFKVPLESEQIAAEMEKLDKSIALAEKLGTSSLVIFGFERDAKSSESDAIKRIIDVLARAAARAEGEGCQLFLENDRGLWAETPDALAQIIAGVGSPALRLNWDPCNLIGVIAAPYPAGYDRVKDFVGHLHVKDAKVVEGKVAHAMMGSGDVDWVGQFARLYNDGYSGYCVIEPHFGSRVESSRSHILETRRALRLSRATLENAAGANQ